MAYFSIVDMKSYFHFLILDDIVGNACVIGIEYTYLQFKALPEILVVQKTRHYCSVYGIMELYN